MANKVKNGSDIIFYGTVVIPAYVEKYVSDVLNFSKPRWMPDNDVSACCQCGELFGAVRRKHHCRQCGRIYCSQCCERKILLRHLSYTMKQRVCSSCLSFVDLLIKTQSSSVEDKLKAALGFNEMCRERRQIISLVEMGGVIALNLLAREKELEVVNLVLKSFSELSAHPALHAYMANVGIITALNRLLLDTNSGSVSELAVNVMNLLTVLCSNEPVQMIALNSGVLDTVLSMCHANSPDAVRLASLQYVAAVSSQSGLFCDALTDHTRRSTLVKLLTLTTSSHPSVQEVSVRILMQISSTTAHNRHRVVQEDLYNGSSVADVLVRHETVSADVLTLAVCLVANLAVDEVSQAGLTCHLIALCNIVSTSSHSDVELLRHAARGLSNFARFRSNSDILMKQFDVICEKLVCSTDECTRMYGCMVTMALLRCQPETCISLLLRHGVCELLHCLGRNIPAINAVECVFASQVPSVAAVPMSSSSACKEQHELTD